MFKIGKSSTLSQKGVYSSYLIIVIIEFVVAAVGAILLTRYKKKHFFAPWICFVVGVHFIWLKEIFLDSSLYILAALLIAVSFLSIFLSKQYSISNSAITGAGAGFILCCFGILGLVRFLFV